MTVPRTSADSGERGGVADGGAGTSTAAEVPSLLTFVTPIGDSDVETGACIDGVCAVDPPR